MFQFRVNHMSWKPAGAGLLGGFHCCRLSRTLVGKGRDAWEQVWLACLGNWPEIGNLKEKAAVTTAETRESEFLEIFIQTFSHADQEPWEDLLFVISFCPLLRSVQASQVPLAVKNPPADAGDVGRSQGWEDPLEEGMVTHSSVLVWRIPWTEEPGGLQPMGSHRVGHDWSHFARMHAHMFSSSCVLFDHLNVSIMREGTVSITFNAKFPEPKISAWHRVISQ